MAGNRSTPPWASYTRALTITPPCQLLNSYIFFILPNRFLPLWNQRKRACGPAGNRSSPFRLRAPQHHHYTTVTFVFCLILLFHSWANLLYGYIKGWGPRLGIDSRSLGFEHHSLDHYTIMAKAERLICFFTLLNPFFSLWNRLKKKLVAQPGIEPGSLI